MARLLSDIAVKRAKSREKDYCRDPHYFDTACRRLEEAQRDYEAGRKAV